MKKLFTLALISVLAIALAACGANNPPSSGSNPATSSTSTSHVSSAATTNAPATTSQTPSPDVYTGDFAIEGKWKSVGEKGWGQAQPGAIIVFDGANCNYYSPKDTYAFYKDGSIYRLDVTSLMGESQSYNVKIVDIDNIEIMYGSITTVLKRV